LECVGLVSQGTYTGWFKTPIGEGSGIVELAPDGRLSGGDSTFSYSGNWTLEGARLRATMSAKRVAPGPPGVFGMDEIEIIMSGESDGDAGFSCTGFAKETPGLKLEVVLIPVHGNE